MAINLFGNLNNANINNTPTIQVGDITLKGAEAAKLLSDIRALLPGQFIEGQLVKQDGNSLQLLLNNTLLLNTNLDSQLQTNLSVGQNVSFEVKSNKDGQLTLRPLYTNLENNPTAVKALEAASVKVNDETLKMVDSLMKEGMPINKEMLQAINREMNLYPDADIRDIVMLHKLNMPVNESNIGQMNLYNNNNQWMLQNVSDMSGDMVELLAELSDEDNDIEGFVNKLETLLQDEKNIEASAKETDNNEIAKSNIFEEIKANPARLKQPEFAEHVKQELGKMLGEKLLMEPEKVANKEYVKSYYDKVLETTKELEQLISTTGKTDSAIAKSVSGMNDNINFMNQINDLYNYVQLPLKMADGQANGDLYVYAKKRNSKGEEDGPLTALLHLSMETLGNMDIFLKLESGKLSTRFELEKEEMIDFIEAHIDELNSRLVAKGYDTTISVGKSKEDGNMNVIDRIQNEAGPVIMLGNQSFDARA